MAVVSFRLLSFLCCLFTVITSQACAQPNMFPFLDHFCIDDKGNYTANSTYQKNLNTLLSTLSSNTEIDYGFYNFSYGQDTDKVNAIGLCRGDVKPDDCRSCLSDIRVNLTKVCPNQKEAIGWYDKCMLRYSNRLIFGIMEANLTFFVWNLKNATKVYEFNQVVEKLLNSLRSTAASGDSRRKYAVANATGPDQDQTVYGLVQCTPDLSARDCDDCLVGAISDLPKCCDGRIGGRVIGPSCNFRYEINRFYELTSDAPTPSSSEPAADDGPPPSSSEPAADDAPPPSSTFTTSPLLVLFAIPLLPLFFLFENL